MGTALKSLLQERHLHEYSEFVAEYHRAAHELPLPRHATPPTKAQYYRWVGGQLHNLPRGYHCLVLERMFPGWTAQQLFASAAPDTASPTSGGLLSGWLPALDVAQLAGVWVTCYRFGTQHHADLSTITATRTGLTATNYPPAPRTDDHCSGFCNDISAGLFGRHIIGQWRNVNDSYYFGSLHLAVLPGEAMLDGYYTAFATDTEVVAAPWRWVRVARQDPADLAAITLREPRQLGKVLAARTHFDGPIPLAEVTEERR